MSKKKKLTPKQIKEIEIRSEAKKFFNEVVDKTFPKKKKKNK